MTRSSVAESFKNKCRELGLKDMNLILSQNGFSIEMIIKMTAPSNPIRDNPEEVSAIVNRVKGKIFGSFGANSSVRSDHSMIFLSVNNNDQDRIEEFLEGFCTEIRNSFAKKSFPKAA